MAANSISGAMLNEFCTKNSFSVAISQSHRIHLHLVKRHAWQTRSAFFNRLNGGAKELDYRAG